MFPVEMYLQIRRACLVEGMSVREASRVFGVHRNMVRNVLYGHSYLESYGQGVNNPSSAAS